MDLLLLIDNEKSHYVYIKDFNCSIKQKNKDEKWFCKSCLQRFSSENALIKHKEICLSINGKKPVKLEKGIIKFENHFKQIPVPFKIYADFECNLKKLNAMKVLIQKNTKTIFLVVLLVKLFVLMMDLVSQLLFKEAKMHLMNLSKQFLKNINIAKK